MMTEKGIRHVNFSAHRSNGCYTLYSPLRALGLDKETHSLLNPWKNLVGNRNLGENFPDHIGHEHYYHIVETISVKTPTTVKTF